MVFYVLLYFPCKKPSSHDFTMHLNAVTESCGIEKLHFSKTHPERLQAKYFHKFQNTFTLAQISSSRNLKEKPIGKYLRAAATGLILSLYVSSSLVTAIHTDRCRVSKVCSCSFILTVAYLHIRWRWHDYDKVWNSCVRGGVFRRSARCCWIKFSSRDQSLLENRLDLIVEAVKNLQILYEIQRLIIVFTTARYSTLFWVTLIQSMSKHPRLLHLI
jgi:hypothetical protein